MYCLTQFGEQVAGLGALKSAPFFLHEPVMLPRQAVALNGLTTGLLVLGLGADSALVLSRSRQCR